MFNDLRLSLRSFRRNPGFTAVAVASLALGIGANTAVFSIFHQVILRSLPVAEPDRLVLFHSEGQDPGSARADSMETVYSYPTYKQLRDRSEVFSGVAGRSGGVATVSERAGVSVAGVELVSGNYFEVLGVKAAIGRAILPADDIAGAHPIAVLGHGYWKGHFGADPRILNSELRVNGHPVTVVGILDPQFLGIKSGQVPDLFVPLAMKPRISPGSDVLNDLSNRWINILARLKPGVSQESAQAASRVLFRQIRNEDLPKIRPMDPGERRDYLHRSLDLVPASQGINVLKFLFKTPLEVLMGMAGLVLLIACANLANLLIARAATREREMAVRTAIGAGPVAIAKQLLTESLTLTVAAAGLGLLAASWGSSGLLKLIGDDGSGSSWLTAQVDVRLFLYALGVAVLAALIFGCAPVWRAWTLDLSTALKSESRTTGGTERQRARRVLVAIQLSLALVLLAAAGLFTRTLMNLGRIDPGFQPASLLTFAVQPNLSGYSKPAAAAFLRTARQRLSTLPGVESVGVSDTGPFMNSSKGTGLYIQGYPGEDAGGGIESVSPGYFRTLRIPVLAGREFSDRDNGSGWRVAVINEALAKRFFRGRNPIGMRLGTDKKMEMEVVGVVRDIRRDSLRETAPPYVYVPYDQTEPDECRMFVRGYGPDMAAAVRAALRQLDRNVPLTDVQTMQARVDSSVAFERSVAMLAAVFGLLAAVLAAVGLYGVVAFSVARRKMELGIRVALGASRGDVYRIVFGEVGWMVLAGTVVGLPLALLLARLAETQLFGVKASDPWMMALAVLALASTAFAAAWVPARRAASVDPANTLRRE